MVRRVVHLAISIAFALLCGLANAVSRALGKGRPGIYTVIYYHGISDSKRPVFARQMDELLRIGTPVGVEAEVPVPEGRRHIAVTFDDGFGSVFRNAISELAKRRICCCVFVPVGQLGKKPGWIKNPPEGGSGESVVTVGELARCQEELVTIGSHGVTHSDLTRLPEEQARQEIMDSRTELESLLGKEVRFFAFPYGAYNERAVQWAKDAGYCRAFSIIPTLRPPTENQFLFGRIDTSTEDWMIEYRLKLLGAYRWLNAAVTAKRVLRRRFRFYRMKR